MTLNVPSTAFRTSYDSVNPPQLRCWRVCKTETRDNRACLRNGFWDTRPGPTGGYRVESTMIKGNQSWLAGWLESEPRNSENPCGFSLQTSGENGQQPQWASLALVAANEV